MSPCVQTKSGSVFANQNGPTLYMSLILTTDLHRPLSGMQVYIIRDSAQVSAT